MLISFRDSVATLKAASFWEHQTKINERIVFRMTKINERVVFRMTNTYLYRSHCSCPNRDLLDPVKVVRIYVYGQIRATPKRSNI